MFVPDALFFYRHCQQRASAYALPTKGAALPLPIASAVTRLAPACCFVALMTELPGSLSCSPSRFSNPALHILISSGAIKWGE